MRLPYIMRLFNIFIAALMFAALGLLWGCASKELEPDVSVNVFRDRVYPCVSVAFPEIIEYKGRQDLSSDNSTHASDTIEYAMNNTSSM